MQPATVVVGAGELGTRFARAWRARHPEAPVVATVRRESSRDRVDVPGVSVVRLDLLRPESIGEVVTGAHQLLSSVAPGPGGGDALWSEGVPNLVACLDPRARTHVVHISSTGIYAADDGEAVDEDAALDSGPRARALAAAERAVREVPGTVLRCSGLVSPGRGPQNSAPRLAGVERPGGDGWLNLVWLDDVVEVIARAFEGRITGTFNVSGPPCRRREFYDPIVERAGLPPIRWVAAESGRGKRVICDRLNERFGFRPRPVRADDLGD